jgi:hypothetical protein
VGAAGCGRGDHPNHSGETRPSGPLAEALAYLPADSGVAIVFATNPARGPLAELERLGSRSRSWRRVVLGLRASLDRSGLDLSGLGSQLGQPFVLGVGSSQRPVGAMRLRDPARLRATVEERERGGKAAPLDPYRDALVWKQSTGLAPETFAAVNGGDLVVAGSERALREAIDTARGNDSLAFDGRFVAGLQRLRGALIGSFGDAQRLLTAGIGPAQELRRIAWVRALGSFEGTVKVAAHDLRVRFRLRTDRRPLTQLDLPLAPGEASPRFQDLSGPAAIALLEPDRFVRFVERVVAVTNPDAYSNFRISVEQLRTLFGVSLHRDLIERIASLSIAIRSTSSLTFVARLRRGSQAAVARTLKKAEPALRLGIGDVLPGTTFSARGSGPSRLWLIRRGGLPLASYALRGGALVGAVGSDRLPRPVGGSKLPGVRGSLALEGDLGRIGRLLGTLLGFPARTLAVVSGLGALELGVRTDTSGLSGAGRLRVSSGAGR